MTEPVAYLVSQEPLSSVRWLSDVKPIGVDDKQITPLYTAEQLHQRVKMTKKQYNTLKWYKDNFDFSACLGTFQNYNGETRMGIKFDDLKGELSDEDIMQAWLYPKTIKVVDE